MNQSGIIISKIAVMLTYYLIFFKILGKKVFLVSDFDGKIVIFLRFLKLYKIFHPISGVGLSLLIDLVRLIDPCHIVQIDSEQDARNLPQQLSDEYAHNTEGWLTSKEIR